MMISERLEHDKYDFQHLEDAAWEQKKRKNMIFWRIFDDFSVWGCLGPNTSLHFWVGPPNFKINNLRRFWSKKILVKNIIKVCTWTPRKNWENRKSSIKKCFKTKKTIPVTDFAWNAVSTYLERLLYPLTVAWCFLRYITYHRSNGDEMRGEAHHGIWDVENLAWRNCLPEFGFHLS